MRRCRFPDTGCGYATDGCSAEVVVAVPDSYADVVERLCGEFDGRVPLSTVTRVVRECRHEVSWSPGDPNRAGVERLARQRLLTASVTAPGQSG